MFIIEITVFRKEKNDLVDLEGKQHPELST